jgi:hypothetical protein
MQYFNEALKIASTNHDIGYLFGTKEAQLENLIALKRTDAARQLAEEVLAEARERHHPQAEAIILTFQARIARQGHDDVAALHALAGL